jgi:hypothetical protein
VERTYTTPLLDKLGVRPGTRVAILGVDDPAAIDPIADRAGGFDTEAVEAGYDLVLLAADASADLDRLTDLARRIQPAGAIWVVSRKGRTATLRDVEVIAAARAAGLVDNKVVAFSETHTALRLVIPRANRPKPGR